MYFLDVIIENNDLLDKLEICAFSSICLLFHHHLGSIYSFIYLSYTPSILHLRSIQSILFIHLKSSCEIDLCKLKISKIMHWSMQFLSSSLLSSNYLFLPFSLSIPLLFLFAPPPRQFSAKRKWKLPPIDFICVGSKNLREIKVLCEHTSR